MYARSLLATVLLLASCAPRERALPSSPSAVRAGPVARSGPIGARAPFRLRAMAPDGAWLVACQAGEEVAYDSLISFEAIVTGLPTGEGLQPYLIFGWGEGEPIDELIAAEPSGRRIVLRRGNSLRLRDTRTHVEVELTRLTPTGQPDDDEFTPPATASFSHDGRSLLFLRRRGGEVVAVVRDLELGDEVELESGPGELRRAMFDPSGGWAVLALLVDDTDGDGHLRWPVRHTASRHTRCRGQEGFLESFFPMEGDRPVRRFVLVGEGPPAEGDDILQPLGASLLRRGSGGELVAESLDGLQSEWVPASCQGRVLHADTRSGFVVVACPSEKDKKVALVELHGVGVHQRFEVSTKMPYGDHLFAEPTRLVAIPAPASYKETPKGALRGGLVDLERQRVLPVRGEVVTTYGAHALIRDDRQRKGDVWTESLWLLDADTGKSTPLGRWTEGRAAMSGGIVLYDGLVLDLDAGRVLGRAPEGAFAVDSRGRVLCGPIQDELLHGPVLWREPLRD